MAEQMHAIRYVTDTLSVAHRDHLPRVIPSLIDHLSICSDVLCGQIENPQIAATASPLVHKLRTQISSLLQDKSIQGRWSAVVLVKATVETAVRQDAGWEYLQASAPWVRGLLAILGVCNV